LPSESELRFSESWCGSDNRIPGSPYASLSVRLYERGQKCGFTLRALRHYCTVFTVWCCYGFDMKRNTKLVDNDSDNEIWQYKSDRQLKHSKLRRSGIPRNKTTPSGKQRCTDTRAATVNRLMDNNRLLE